MSRPVVLLDRDGTILEERGYLTDPDRLRLLPGAAGALARLQRAGLRLALVTNQSAIGRGLLAPERLAAIHVRLAAELAREGVTLDGIFVCRHHPDEGCRCRKPRPGLVEEAAARLRFDPATAWVIGDNACDIDLARHAGARSVLVLTGHGTAQPPAVRARADIVAADLPAAAGRLLERLARTGRREVLA